MFVRVRFLLGQPMVKAGWKTEAVRGDYATPVTHRDKEITSGVTELVWSGGDLPSDFYDEFVLRGAVASGVVQLGSHRARHVAPDRLFQRIARLQHGLAADAHMNAKAALQSAGQCNARSAATSPPADRPSHP